MVMLVSSVWHGVHSGHYHTLGSVPFCLMVSSNNVTSEPNILLLLTYVPSAIR